MRALRRTADARRRGDIEGAALAAGAKRRRAVAVAEMAGEAGVEERTFQRRFQGGDGDDAGRICPAYPRVGKARELLEFTKRTVDQIALGVGYEDAAAFRKVFHRLIGLSPHEYRQRFSTPAVAGRRVA